MTSVVIRPLFLQRPRARVRQAVRDVFLVIAALAMFGAQALSTLHFALVPHHLCAEHGVLEDGTAGAKAGAHDDTTESASTNASAPDDEQNDHDACSVATRSEHGALLERPALGRPTLVPLRVRLARPSVVLEVDRAVLLSRAPKTSPPARG